MACKDIFQIILLLVLVTTNSYGIKFGNATEEYLLEGKSSSLKNYLKQQKDKATTSKRPNDIHIKSNYTNDIGNPYKDLQAVKDLLASQGLLGSSRFGTQQGPKNGPQKGIHNSEFASIYGSLQKLSGSHRPPNRPESDGNPPYVTRHQTPASFTGPGGGRITKNQYRDIWMDMLQGTYKILKDKMLLHSDSTTAKQMEYLFEFLNEIDILDADLPDEIECPNPYSRVGSLCLSLDFLETFLDYDEARLYCQMVKGGDLAMFKDANEFALIQKFLRAIDSERTNSYWIGLSDQDTENDWRFLDGRTIRKGAPFWGVDFLDCDDAQNYTLNYTLNTGNITVNHTVYYNGSCPTNYTVFYMSDFTSNFTANYTLNYTCCLGEILLQLQPEWNNTIENYAVLANWDFYYIHDANNTQAEEWNTIPLCQFIPERDQTNFQYGEAIWEDWSGYNYWKGWIDDGRHKYMDFFPSYHSGGVGAPVYSGGGGAPVYSGGGWIYGG